MTKERPPTPSLPVRTNNLRRSTPIEEVMRQIQPLRSANETNETARGIRIVLFAALMAMGVLGYQDYKKESVEKETAQAQAIQEAEREKLREIRRKGQEEVRKILHPELKSESQRIEKAPPKPEPHRSPRLNKPNQKKLDQKKHKRLMPKKLTRVDGAVI